jgi:hypothetical protein
MEVTVEPQKLIVALLLGMWLAWRWALNQMESPAPIAVPLRFDWMHDCAHAGHGDGVGVGVEHGVGQLRGLGENVIGMVLNPTNVAEPEKLLLSIRGPSDCVTQVLKVGPLAVKGIELLMVIGVPDDGVTVIS